MADEVLELNADDDLFAGFNDDLDMGEPVDTDEAEEIETEEAVNEDATTGPIEEANQAEDEPSEEAEAQEETETEVEAAPQNYQFIETKYNHEARTYDLANPDDMDEVVRNIQKGRDYDRIRTERDTLKGESAKLKYLEDALNLIKGDRQTGYDLLDEALADNLIKSEAEHGRTLDEAEALRRIKANRDEIFNPVVQSVEELNQKSIDEFARAYPTLDPSTIPQSVWVEFAETHDLKSAYERYTGEQEKSRYADLQKENDALKAELETMKQNEKNRARSTGSQKSAGANPVADADFEGWPDD